MTARWIEAVNAGDDAYAVERAADPLHCAGIDSKLFRNDAHTVSR
jgi:hypothetical protein